ncbi:MAG: phenylalanine--tRNA ligase subunit beta [Clostridiales bacterium]|nr:phenylalanine--tRNA ligase subunit beta [Clostridiales bacterium]MCF8023116.1 phenylalanine--tRNA ligase subunit beta [Clostridiales bacterium]
MKVSYKWLQEYVDIPVSPLELADSITSAGLEVDSVAELGKEIEKVYTGKIVEISSHPNADKLIICSVNVGGENNRQIVTGADNVKENNIIPVAVEGARLAGGLKIKKTKLRGIESRGMLCSGGELGLDTESLPENQAHGIMILPSDTPVGEDARKYTGLDDAVIELELTPNRGDCLSMIGVAREVAAIYNTSLKLPGADPKSLDEYIDGKAEVIIENNELCRRYVAKLLTGVKVFSSPVWMQERLRSAGIRPINNVVDVTNYVLMELGQPLHAFDYDKLKDGKIIVRRAKEGEILQTLDGTERKMKKDMLVIADSSGPVAIAGVMGGADSEVTGDTSMVLLESAYFDPSSVRRTSNYLGLRSESSLRFEKGIDVNGCLRAAQRAAKLLQEMGACSVLAGQIDNYPEYIEEKTIPIRPSRVGYLLGKEISQDECKNILSSLQFKVQQEDEEGFLVTVPTFRPDISREVDLIEEVARIHGYDRIPQTLPSGESTEGGRTERQRIMRQLRRELVACGVYEAITYSFHSRKEFDRLRIPEDSYLRNTIKIQNPLTEEQEIMRTLMLPGVLDIVRHNYSRRNYNAAVFDTGKVFHPRDNSDLPEEREKLAAVFTGKTENAWNTASGNMDFYYVKGILEAVLNRMGVKGCSLEPAFDNMTYHPGRSAYIQVHGEKAGIIGEIHPLVLENYELDQKVTAFEFDMEVLLQYAGKKDRYIPLPKYPGTNRDLAVVVAEDILARDVFRLIRKAGGELLRDVKLFDVYKGNQVSEGCQSMAFSLKFQAADRTLTDEEVNERISSITSILQKEFDARLRS